MAISFVGSAEGSAQNGGDVTLDLTTISGLAQNDLVIVAYSIADTGDVDHNMAMVTAGYTEVADLWADDTDQTNLGVYYKFMGASPDASAVVDGLGGANAAVTAACMAFRGVDTTTPMDVSATTATGINTMDPDPPSISTFTEATSWTVIAVGSGYAGGGTTDTYTFPAGYTTNAVDVSQDDPTATLTALTGMGYRTNPSDPENPGTMAASPVDNIAYSWAAVTMALRLGVATHERAVAVDVSVVIATAPQRDLLRSVGVDASVVIAAGQQIAGIGSVPRLRVDLETGGLTQGAQLDDAISGTLDS